MTSNWCQAPTVPLTINPLTTLYNSSINPNLKMFQPRIGFNWNFQPGTVIRGGYGMFYGDIYNTAYYNDRRENGVYQIQYTVKATHQYTPYGTTGCTVTGACNSLLRIRHCHRWWATDLCTGRPHSLR